MALQQRSTSKSSSTNTNPKRRSKRETGSKDNASKTDAKVRATKVASRPSTSTQEETLWQTFSNHPLVVTATIILVPYAAYVTFYWISLEHPEIASYLTLGLVQLRPAVHPKDPRQLLLVGSMGSGVDQVTSGLAQLLDLEVTHESMDASNYFCRDGTVSSLLGIRYAPKPPLAFRQRVWHALCFAQRDKGSFFSTTNTDIFHPKYYRKSNCSSYASWSRCWAKECVEVLEEQWGCAWLAQEGDDESSSSSCQPTFARVLLQVQSPIRTVQELMARVCPGGKVKTPHPAFVKLALPFLQDLDQDEGLYQLGQHNNTEQGPSCLRVVAWYVVHYHRMMLDAVKAQHIHGLYRYEDVSSCDVAQLFGFLDPSSISYPFHGKKLRENCFSNKVGLSKPQAKMAVVKVKQSRPDELQALPNVSWGLFQEAGGVLLVEELQNLCKELGYQCLVDKEETESPETSL